MRIHVLSKNAIFESCWCLDIFGLFNVFNLSFCHLWKRFRYVIQINNIPYKWSDVALNHWLIILIKLFFKVSFDIFDFNFRFKLGQAVIICRIALLEEYLRMFGKLLPIQDVTTNFFIEFIICLLYNLVITFNNSLFGKILKRKYSCECVFQEEIAISFTIFYTYTLIFSFLYFNFFLIYFILIWNYIFISRAYPVMLSIEYKIYVVRYISILFIINNLVI